MKITGLQTYHLRHQLAHPTGCAPLLYTQREALLVQVRTDEGLDGWGETAPLGGVRGLIEGQLGPLLLGHNPLEHRRLWRRLWGANFGNGLAVGAVDMALHDLRGKALNLPVAELYGGRLRDRVPVYASSLSYLEGREPGQHYPVEAAALVKQGFRAIKLRIGRFEPSQDLAAAAAVRAAVGPEIRLMADGNGAYTLPTAVHVGRELDQLGFTWFEEPLPQAQYAGYEELRRKLDIALAGGEVLDSRGTARDLLARGTFDIIQPDASLCGGIGECLFIAEMARLWGVQCHPHCWAGAITVAATLHVLALLPDASWSHTTETPLLELDVTENPFRDRLTARPPRVEADGCIAVPTDPGLGIEIDVDALKQYECR